MAENDNDALERESEVLLARAGISVPPERRAGVIGGCREMRRFAAVLRREPLPAESEPSNTFSLERYVRGD